MAKDLRRKIYDQVLPHIHGRRKVYINISAATGSAVGIGDANHCLNGSLSGSAIYRQYSDL